jgi:hypothetical protein
MQSWAQDFIIEPSLVSRVIYDDNVDFEAKDEQDDFAANLIPRLTLNHTTELLDLSLIGEVDILQYFNQTDFDRTNQLYGVDGRYLLFPRFAFAGNFQYRKDETIDSQLQETGQFTERDRVTTYDGGGGLFFKLTELSDIGFNIDYRKRSYSSDDNTDFDRYTFSLPYTKQFANQRDEIRLVPAYSIFDSDQEDAKDYRLTFGWERQISETLESDIRLGVRYTDIEQQEDNNDDSNLGYLGRASLKKIGETYTGEIAISRDIRANADGQLIEVNRLKLRADKQLRERFGFRFDGAGYFSKTDSSDAKNEKTTYFELQPAFYYRLTENHSLVLAYAYQRKIEHDKSGDPTTQRNRAWIGLELKFPKKL